MSKPVRYFILNKAFAEGDEHNASAWLSPRVGFELVSTGDPAFGRQACGPITGTERDPRIPRNCDPRYMPLARPPGASPVCGARNPNRLAAAAWGSGAGLFEGGVPLGQNLFASAAYDIALPVPDRHEHISHQAFARH